MARRRRKQPPHRREDPVHEEILQYLEEHPPPASKSAPPPRRSASSGKGGKSSSEGGKKHPGPAGTKRPSTGGTECSPGMGTRRSRLMLRKLPLELALETLERFLVAKRRLGEEELIVIVGKGHGSPGGVPVLGPEVRRWLDEHPRLVASWEEAPLREGGSGALLVRLEP